MCYNFRYDKICIITESKNMNCKIRSLDVQNII